MAGLLLVAPPGSSADALCSALEADGVVVHRATSGAEGVAIASERLPQVVVLDPALSAMDRWSATRRLADAPQTARIPVVTLPERATLDEVVARIERTAGPLWRGESLEPPSAPREAPVPALVSIAAGPTDGAAARPKWGRLLLADPNGTHRDAWAQRLSRRGFEVEGVASGADALAALDRARFDCILLDLSLGDPDGIDVLHRIRQRSTPIALPVVVTSAPASPEAGLDDQLAALKAEANDYLARPVDLEVLVARIRAQLSLAAAHRDLVQREQRYRAIVESAADLVLLHRPDGEILYASPSSRVLLGLEPSELVGRSLWDALHPLDRRTLEARGPLHPSEHTFIARLRTRDGRYVWVETSSRTLRQDGAAVVVAACRDVTDHMERIGDDEPPLPLGGDIVAHPGWRSGSGAGATPPPTSSVTRPLVLTVVLGEPAVAVDELSRQVSRELRKVLEPAADRDRSLPLSDEGESV